MNPRSTLKAAPPATPDVVLDPAEVAGTGSGPRAGPAAAQQPLLGPLRARYLLYGLASGLAAMTLQVLAIDRPMRGLLPAGAVGPAAPPPASAPIDPQPFQSVPEPVEGAPESAGQPDLDERLARARRQIDALALTSPPGDNALETLKDVLAAVPSQPDALQGIRDIAGKYAMLAVQADKRGQRDLAKRYLDKGLRLAPDHPDLRAVEQRLARAPIQPDRIGTAPIRPAGTTK